jgi:hypothetical protein
MPNLDTAKQFAAANYADWHKSLTLEETSALRTYAAAKGDYHALNDQLRGQADTEEGRALTERLCGPMDAAIDRAAIRADVVLWRGANQTEEFADPEALVGKVIQDNGYVSTGLTEDRGGQWAATAERHGEVPLLIEVRAPKGTKGAYLEDIQTTESGKPSEFEVLLPRGSRFRVVSYRASRKKGFLVPFREAYPLLTVEVVR